MALYCPPSHTLRGLFFFPLFWFFSSFLQKSMPGHVCVQRRVRRWGQQVEHKNTCLPHPFYLPSWGWWAEGTISSPSEPCNQDCQAQLPQSTPGWHAKRCAGKLGSLAGCCYCAGRKHGACQTTASLSGGSARLDRPDVFRHRGMHRSTAKSWEAIRRQW